jgi:glycosyltransferase involved in cell wall biosynthesis
MKKLAIITTHPIQYYAPIFQLMHQRQNICIKVFYTVGQAFYSSQHDPGFGKKVSWDVPVLEGYPYEWALNTAEAPGTRSFRSIITPGLIQQVNYWQPDALMIIGWAYASHLKAIRYFKNKIPVYFRGDSTLLNEPGGIKKAVKSVFLRWVYRHVDHVFFAGVNNKAYFRKYGIEEGQLSFTPHAIDNARFIVPRYDDALKFRSVLNVSNNAVLILYAGKFEPVKNIELLISAFITLNRHNVHLLLVGNGVDEKKLKDMASASVDATNIHFCDFVNQLDMPVLYQAADLFCLPSWSESWGLSVNEAMACGCAILASDKVGCAADLIINEKNGMVFKSRDLNSLTECLKFLTESKVRLTAFGEQSRMMIKDWNFTNIVRAIETQLLNEPE